MVPRVSFSSDEQGMPWEFMGVYYYFQSETQDVVSHRPEKQHLERIFKKLAAYLAELQNQTTRYSVADGGSKIPTISQKKSHTELSTAYIPPLFQSKSSLISRITPNRRKSAATETRGHGNAHHFPCPAPSFPTTPHPALSVTLFEHTPTTPQRITLP